jgi:cell division protein FtsI (penicillin-binding protein 3)
VLARTVFRYDVNAAPKNVGSVFKTVDGVRTERTVEQIVAELAPLIELSTEELTLLLAGDSEYSSLAKKVDAETYNAIRELFLECVTKLNIKVDIISRCVYY